VVNLDGLRFVTKAQTLFVNKAYLQNYIYKKREESLTRTSRGAVSLASFAFFFQESSALIFFLLRYEK
jgi:hypothetical protein